MSHRYLGGLITKTPVTPTAQAAPGVWTLEQALQYIKAGTWPTPQNGDPYWAYTNLLLGTTSTNGAQNNTFLDSSANAYSVTRSGNPTQGTLTPLSLPNGYWGNYFDGSGDWLTVPDNTALKLTGDFTFECWVNPQSTGNTQTLFRQESSSYSPIVFILDSNLAPGVYASSSGGAWEFSLLSTPACPAFQWSHVAFVRSSNNWKIFINGTQVASSTSSISIYNSSAVNNIGAVNSNFYYKGFLSNLRIVKGTALYTSDFTPSTTPLTAVSGTSLLTCQSNYFKDNSTNNFAFTRYGDVKVLPFAPFGNPSGYRANAVSGSGYFDGTGDYLTTGYTGFFGTGDYTISFWIYMDAYVSPDNNGADGGFVYIYNQGSSHPTYPLGVSISKAGKVVVVDSVNFGPTWESTFDYAGSYNTANSVKLGQWNYVHLYRQSGTLYIYCNGGLQLSVAQASALAAPVTNGTIIPQGYCQGFLTDFRLVTSAITDPTPPTTPATAVTNTQLLLNFTNAGLYDLAAKNDMETVGNAQVSTSVVKYGAGSAYFDGTGDWLAMPGNNTSMIGTGEYTVEGWIYKDSAASGERGIISSFDASTYGFGIWTDSSTIYFEERQTAYNSANPRISATFTTTNSWVHVAMSRQGGTLKAYVNGNLIGSTSTNLRSLSSVPVSYLGRNLAATNPWQGYLSDFRLTVGLGRYPYNFTPPAAALPSYYQALTPTSDPYFEYTTLLLPGNGTNGAQNNTFLDSSANTFSITRNGNTTQGTFSPFSQTGWGNYFDGNDSLTVAYNSAFQPNTYASLECWVYFNSFAADTLIVGREGMWLNYSYTAIGASSNKIAFSIYNSSGNWYAANSTFTPVVGQWYHIVGVRDNATLRIYINGTQEGTANFVGTPNPHTSAFAIGASFTNTNNVTGYISNVRYCNGATSGALPYTANFTPPTSALTATSATILLTCQSNRFVDNSASPYTLTVVGNPSVQAFSPFNPTASWSAATNGGSGYFDGTGDYLQSSITALSGQFTVEFWVYRPAAGNNFLFTIGDSSTSSGAEIYIGSSGAQLNYYSSNAVRINGGTPPAAGQWNYIAVTRDASNEVRMYVNGTQVGSSYTQSGTLSTDLRVGAEYYGGSITGTLNGYMGAFRVSNTVRTVTSVPTALWASDANTVFLANFTNAGIYDATAKNDLETVGNAQISTTQSKFGGSSMYFDGSGDDLRVVNAGLTTGFGTGDFTVEFWIYANSWAAYNNLIDFRKSTDYFLIMYTSGAIQYYNNGAYRINGGSLSTSTWHHIAVVRYGTNTNMFVNGSLVGSTYVDTSNYPAETVITIGARNDDAAQSLNGYMQDVRITKGIARYTQNFTPPATAFLTL